MPLGRHAVFDHSDFCADATWMIWLLLVAKCCREVKALLHVHIPHYCYPCYIFSLFCSFWTCSEAWHKITSFLWAVIVQFPNICGNAILWDECDIVCCCISGHPCTYSNLAQLTILFSLALLNHNMRILENTALRHQLDPALTPWRMVPSEKHWDVMQPTKV